jgi:hypothetical protein
LIWYPALTGYPVSGFWTSRISGKNGIRCIPSIKIVMHFGENKIKRYPFCPPFMNFFVLSLRYWKLCLTPVGHETGKKLIWKIKFHHRTLKFTIINGPTANLHTYVQYLANFSWITVSFKLGSQILYCITSLMRLLLMP